MSCILTEIIYQRVIAVSKILMLMTFCFFREKTLLRLYYQKKKKKKSHARISNCLEAFIFLLDAATNTSFIVNFCLCTIGKSQGVYNNSQRFSVGNMDICF
jgi:hypothetical protein